VVEFLTTTMNLVDGGSKVLKHIPASVKVENYVHLRILLRRYFLPGACSHWVIVKSRNRKCMSVFLEVLKITLCGSKVNYLDDSRKR
jgi:hypothetical protein